MRGAWPLQVSSGDLRAFRSVVAGKSDLAAKESSGQPVTPPGLPRLTCASPCRV
jgi:hypothetical protein